jgi:hypothetical protein
MLEIGNNSLVIVVTQLLNDFTSIRFGLLVGIRGGIPSVEFGVQTPFYILYAYSKSFFILFDRYVRWCATSLW